MLKTPDGRIIGNVPGNPYHHGIRLLKRREVEADTGLSRSGIYKLMREGRFPLPVTLGPKSVAWVSTEVEAWCLARIADRDQAAA